MHHLIMRNIGPISKCDIDIDNFTVFTGTQASGKSTIAKSIFFFRTVKDDVLETLLRRGSLYTSKQSLYKAIHTTLRYKFLQIFGSSRAMSSDLYLKYQYNNDTYIKITLRLNTGEDYISPNYVYIDYSQSIRKFIDKYTNYGFERLTEKNKIAQELSELFSDDYETIFIPAGRSLITLLTTQLNYIFTIMDDEQRYSIDFCTQKYIERILKIRSLFEEGIAGYLDKKKTTSVTSHNQALIKKCLDLVDNILKGKYQYVSGEERLIIDDNKYVKINFTSSGQQESVWIFNILMYQLINNTKTFIILEEPEAHLYPNAQKEITELLSMFESVGNSLLITTHSPYVLGSINNLLYAHLLAQLSQENTKNVKRIMDMDKSLSHCASYFVNQGKIEKCLDEDSGLIKNETIDGASDEINELFDRLIEIESGELE